MREEGNPWNVPHKEIRIDLIRVWNWLTGRKRRKFREWLADNRKRRRQNLRYKGPITEAELYAEMDEDNGNDRT